MRGVPSGEAASACNESSPGSVPCSIVILVDAGTQQTEAGLARASAVMSELAGGYELIVVAQSPGAEASAMLRQLGEAARSNMRVFLLTEEVDRHTAAWHGIENTRGDRVAVLDPSRDDIGFLPALLRRADAGADLVFARNTDREPPRLRRAIARRLRDTLQSTLGVASVDVAAPTYRVLSRAVVHFIAQHPDPVAAYSRLPAGCSFTLAHLTYSSRAHAPARSGPLERVGRRARRLLSATLDTLSRLQGHDTTFHDPARGEETICLPQIPSLRRGRFEIDEHFRQRGTSRYNPANPTLARFEGQTWVNVRLVNYLKRGHGSTLSGDDVYRSRNLVFAWDPRSEEGRMTREIAGAPASWTQATRVRGLEDQRWIVHDDRLWFSACCCQVPYEEGSAKMVLGRMNERLDAVDHLVPLRYDAARETEKNWLLWSTGGRLLAIYGYHPFTLLEVDPDSGQTRAVRVQRPPFVARGFRGSAGPVPIAERPGHWLMLVHEVARRFDQPVYAHRWLLVHPELGMLACSRPFVFDHVGIEYAAGLLDNGDGTLTVTYGFEDREARWVVLDRAGVLASLHATPPGELSREAESSARVLEPASAERAALAQFSAGIFSGARRASAR